MRAPINEYYTDKEYEFALKEMRRIMERKRALAEAQAAQKAREKVKKEFQTRAKQIALETKITITNISSQMDTAIRGNILKRLEMYVPNMLVKYDDIGK